MTNKSLYTNVSIKKTGYVEVMPGQQIRYDFSGIGNNSTTSLTSFYWRDTLLPRRCGWTRSSPAPITFLETTRWSIRPTSPGTTALWRTT